MQPVVELLKKRTIWRTCFIAGTPRASLLCSISKKPSLTREGFLFLCVQNGRPMVAPTVEIEKSFSTERYA